MSELASGTTWKLELSKDGNHFILELHSIYGTVEVKLKGTSERYMGSDIQHTYERLKAQGPIEVESQVE